MNDFVSIIIPAFNAEKTIKKSVQSCLNQSHSNIEVIIVDDGSTDGTYAAASSIGDSRIRYLKLQQNGGVCKARNFGIEFARGDFITFLDADDELLPWAIKYLLSEIQDKDISVGFYELCDSFGNVHIP